MYMLAHPQTPLDTGWASDWSLSHFFAMHVTNSDGIFNFPQTMAQFYILDPLRDSAAGFLSVFLVPAVAVGIGVLFWRRRWDVLALLVTWWLLPALFFSGTTYQTHRFVLAYLPAIVILAGMGIGSVIGWLMQLRPEWPIRWNPELRKQALTAIASVVLLLATGAALIQGERATERQVGQLMAIKDDEQRVVSLVKSVASGSGNTPPPPPEAPPAAMQ